jgi:hypothetical protein
MQINNCRHCGEQPIFESTQGGNQTVRCGSDRAFCRDNYVQIEDGQAVSEALALWNGENPAEPTPAEVALEALLARLEIWDDAFMAVTDHSLSGAQYGTAAAIAGRRTTEARAAYRAYKETKDADYRKP